jgi:acetyl esterase/lipase
MSWEVDPEIDAGLAAMHKELEGVEEPPVGDVAARREIDARVIRVFIPTIPTVSDVDVATYETSGADGASIPMTLFAPAGAPTDGLVLYIHGGGMIMGSVDEYVPVLRFLASRSKTALLAVDYRLAPEHPHPAPVDDCYAALRWAAENAPSLGYDPARIAIAGDSAGGGLTAATALLARDRGGPPVKLQVLIYPMLDDRTVSPPANGPSELTWSYADNATGWGALLGSSAGAEQVSPYAAPARAESLVGLPPAYVMVGTLDIFRDEDIEYAARLAASGVPTELHVYPSAPHAFDMLAFASTAAQRAIADEIRVLASV